MHNRIAYNYVYCKLTILPEVANFWTVSCELYCFLRLSYHVPPVNIPVCNGDESTEEKLSLGKGWWWARSSTDMWLALETLTQSALYDNKNCPRMN